MVTMKDVASAAGVSVATVSNYLNNTKTVSAARSEKIAEAIERLHYVPNQMAKTLKSRVNHNVGVVLPNIQDNYYVQIFQGIERYLNEKNYFVNLCISNDLAEMEQGYIFELLKSKAAGLIIITSQPDNFSFFENHILSQNMPFVHMDRRISLPNSAFLSFDNRKTLRELTNSFIEADKRDIAIITGPPNYSCERAAMQGYIDAFSDHNIPLDNSNILFTLLSKEAAFRCSILHLEKSKPQVIITTSSLVTIGVMESLAIAGYKVPSDIIVATLGEDNWNRFNDFQNIVSTSREAISMGREGAKLLCKQIESPTYRPKLHILEDKYQKQTPLAKIRRQAAGNTRKIKVMMLDTLQVELFAGLISHFKNITQTDVDMRKVPHNLLLHEIYNDPADVIMYDIPWLHSLVDDGMLVDITHFIKDKDIYLKDSLEVFGGYRNRLYGLPFMYAPQILFYRKDIFQNRAIRNEFFKKYKIKLQPPRTFNEFNLISDFFNQRSNPSSPTKFGTAIPAAYEECLVPEIYMRMNAYGSEVFNKKSELVLNSLQTVKAYKNFMKLLESSAPDYMGLNDMMVVDNFLNGDIAMLITYPSFISNINDLQRSCQIGQVGFSHIPGKSPILGGWGLGVSENSENKEDAFRFIDWACGKDMANYSTIMAGQSAIARSFDNNELISLYPWLPLYKEVYEFSHPIKPPSTRNRTCIPQHKIDKTVSDWMYRLIDGDINVESAVYNTHLELEDLLQKANGMQ